MASELTIIINALFSVFLICGAGAFSHHLGWLDEAVEQKAMKLIINLFLPCFIITSLLNSEEFRDSSLIATAFGSGFLIAILGILTAYLVGRLTQFKKGSGLRTFALTTGVQNYGFLAIPLLMAVYPTQSESIIGTAFIHGIGVEIAMWTIGLSTLSGSLKIEWKRIINAPSIAVLMSLIIVHSELAPLIPDSLIQSASMLGKCTFPVALLLIGATLYELRKNIEWTPKILLTSILTRLLILPAFYLVAGLLTPEASSLRLIFTIQIAMPAAMMPILIAKHHGGHPKTAAQAVISTSLASIITIPIWIIFAKKILLP